MSIASLARALQQEDSASARMFVKVCNGMREDGAMVDDMSPYGLTAVMHDTSAHKLGSYVEIFNEKLGSVAGYVSSVRPGRIGIEFDRTTNNLAKITAFFRLYVS